MLARRLLAALLVVAASGCSRDAGASGSSGAARSATPSTGEHGTDILDFGDPVVADRLRQTVLDFLAGL